MLCSRWKKGWKASKNLDNSEKELTVLQILIVDDEPQIRRILARLVLRLECQAAKAATGEEALAWLNGHSADLLLLDLRMPGIGGMAVLQEVRSRWPDLPVVIITAYGSLESGIDTNLPSKI